MKKVLLTVIAIMLSTTISSAAFAGQSVEQVFSSNPQVSISLNNKDSYNWRPAVTKTFRDYGIYKTRITHLDRILYRHSIVRYHYYWDYDRYGERYFYVDSSGANRYFYLDPYREYAVHQYKDKYGVTQFWFEDIGWK